MYVELSTHFYVNKRDNVVITNSTPHIIVDRDISFGHCEYHALNH